MRSTAKEVTGVPQKPKEFVTHTELESSLMQQEHRLLPILHNFFVRRIEFEQDDPRRAAAAHALLWRISVALAPAAAVGSAGITAILGVCLAWRANSLISEQNVTMAKQVVQVEHQNALLEEQTALLKTQNSLTEANRRSSLGFELSAILQEIGEKATELDGGPTIDSRLTLSRTLQGRIVALSRVLKPYRYLDDSGKLIPNPLSPERGQLLLALVSANVELDKFASELDMSLADLRGATLNLADLRQLNLRRADFTDASLILADLRGADLSGARFVNANLSNADLTEYYAALSAKADFFRQRVTTLMHGADFKGALLYHACFSSEAFAGDPIPSFRGAYADKAYVDVCCYAVRDVERMHFVQELRRSQIDAKTSEDIVAQSARIQFDGYGVRSAKDKNYASAMELARGNVVELIGMPVKRHELVTTNFPVKRAHGDWMADVFQDTIIDYSVATGVSVAASEYREGMPKWVISDSRLNEVANPTESKD
jgi:uncharacterized protein YjbI with pentapeptide repeats